MENTRKDHHRRSFRIPGYDYTQPGAYFVTIVTQDRLCLFGDVVEGKMRLNEFGRVADQEIHRLAARFPYVTVDPHIVMPNHIHAMIWIREAGGVGVPVGAQQEESPRTVSNALAAPLQLDRPTGLVQGPPAGSLGRIIATYKAFTTRLINGLRHSPGAPLWQRNYYEHIIRDAADWDRLHRYIEANPLLWPTDEENR